MDEESLKRLLVGTEHVLSYQLMRQTDADDARTMEALAEACEFFARDADEHRAGLVFANELLAEDTWENRADRLWKTWAQIVVAVRSR